MSQDQSHTVRKRMIIQALNHAINRSQPGEFTSHDLENLRAAREYILERPSSAAVVLLTKAEASAIDHGLGNSMDDGADKDVFVVGSHRAAAWRGREIVQRAAFKKG